MRRTFVLFVLSLTVCSIASAAGWKKSYFGATKPGTWARYLDHSADPANPDMTVTMTRLGDQEGQARIETIMDSAGKYPLAINRYTVKSGFNLDRDLIDYGSAVVGGEAGDNVDTLSPLDAATAAIIAGATPPYAPHVELKGSEIIDGKKTDHYSYTMNRPGPSVETGDLWLSDAVPFGLVRNTFTLKEKDKTTKFERKLIASGAGAAVPASTPAKPPARTKATLREAYDEGLIRIDAEVDPATKNGEKVHLVITLKEDAPSPFTIEVPKGKTSLHVDMPLDDFIINVGNAQTLSLTTEKGAELDVMQGGEQRAMKGKFQISTMNGTPLWSGSATIGWVK
jgi:hypothetical protein